MTPPVPLELLPALRRLDEDGLQRLVVDRRVPLRGIAGLIDLAEWLRSPAGVERALDGLGWRRMRRLADGDPGELDRAMRLLLADERGALLPEVADALEARLADDGGPAEGADDAAALAHAAEAAFASLVHAAELLHALDGAPRAAREDRDGPRLAGVEARRIASELGVESDRIAALARIAVHAGLAAAADGALRPTERGRTWLREPMADRWRDLADAWLGSLSAAERRELLAPASPAAAGVDAAADEPSADTGAIATRRAGELAGRILGVVADGQVSPVGRLALDDRLPEAAGRLESAFPTPVDRVYIQPDCSIIAPGPLRPDLDERLREAAELEQPGLAATYRISRGSVHRDLAAGATRDGILELLEEISLGPVPQPVRYLVEEAAERYGAVRVRPHADPFARGSRILADDDRLLDALEVDRSLGALGLARVADGELSARVGPEGAYWSLLEAGHPVAAETADGEAWTLRRRRTAAPAAPTTPQGVERLVQALAEDPARSDGADGDEAWMRRRLELARRDKAPVRIAVEHAGSRTELVLVPTSVSGPRLRGRDVAADVERTIPIASIAEVLDA